MPLGLWKSKWEIHREDMARRDAEYREDRERWDAETRDLRRRSDEIAEEMRAGRRRSDEIAEETRDLRADYDREIAEVRLFNRELLIRMEKTYANLGTTLEALGTETHELKASVDAQTEAILRLVDRFEDADGQPPV